MVFLIINQCTVFSHEMSLGSLSVVYKKEYHWQKVMIVKQSQPKDYMQCGVNPVNASADVHHCK